MKWLTIGAGVAAFSLVVSGQDPLPDWVLRLSRVKHHLRDNFERIPNYVCRENVERFRKLPGRGRSVRIDSLQFDVAQVDHKELLALPGAGGFEDKDLSAYISSGILGTGNFSSQPINLFVADRARFTPHAETAAWDYEIPAFMHGYEIVNEGRKFPVGVRGTFWVDAESMDLIRIEEQVVDPPPQTGMSATSSTVRYARTEIGGSSVLLPQSAELTVVHLDGAEMRNQIGFSGCRAYISESTVHFGDTVEPLPAVKKK